MADQLATTRDEAYEALLNAVKDAAPNAHTYELKGLAEAYELLTRHA